MKSESGLSLAMTSQPLEKYFFKDEHILFCRSCAAMEICGTIWSLLSLWRLWARWATNWAGWAARCCKVMSRLKICTSLSFVWSQYFRAGKQREVWECAKVSKADQLVHGYHKRFTIKNGHDHNLFSKTDKTSRCPTENQYDDVRNVVSGNPLPGTSWPCRKECSIGRQPPR